MFELDRFSLIRMHLNIRSAKSSVFLLRIRVSRQIFTIRFDKIWTLSIIDEKTSIENSSSSIRSVFVRLYSVVEPMNLNFSQSHFQVTLNWRFSMSSLPFLPQHFVRFRFAKTMRKQMSTRNENVFSVRTIWSKRCWSSLESRVRSVNWFSNCSILSRKFWRKKNVFLIKKKLFFIFDRTCWEIDSFSHWIRKVSRCCWTSFNWRSRSRS